MIQPVFSPLFSGCFYGNNKYQFIMKITVRLQNNMSKTKTSLQIVKQALRNSALSGYDGGFIFALTDKQQEAQYTAVM